jgi:hypothetical protein
VLYGRFEWNGGQVASGEIPVTKSSEYVEKAPAFR